MRRSSRALAPVIASAAALSLCVGAQPSTLALPPPGIFVMNADGTAQRNLTNDGLWSLNPDWSPTGDKIVYSRGYYAIWTGLHLAKAQTRIRRAHCRVGRVRRARSDRVGRVLPQDPRAGKVLPKGALVRLVVGRRAR